MPRLLFRLIAPACALALVIGLAVAGSASAATVVNGDFEAGDLSGWTQVSPAGQGWAAYSGTANPINGHAIDAPPQGTYGAVSGQFGPGSRILYQDVALAAGEQHTLKLQVYYANMAGSFVSPDSLDSNVGPNQQYRIDVLSSASPVASTDPADVLATVFRTQPGDPAARAPFALSADLSAFAGQTVRLRFAQVDNAGYFSAAADDVHIDSCVEQTVCPDALDLGARDVDDGATAISSSTITNSAPDPIVMSALTLSGADAADFELVGGAPGDCTPTTTLATTETCTLRVRFDPSATGARAATLTIASDGPDRTVALSGTGIQTELSLDPVALDLGSFDVDDGATGGQTSTLTNSGTEPVALSGLALTGDDSDFERLTGDPGDCTTTTTLAAGETCAVRVRFDPSATGARAATLTIGSAVPDQTIALTGTGTQLELSVAPDTLDFGSLDVDDGPTAGQATTLTNTGTERVTVTDLTLTGDDADFDRLTGDPTDCGEASSLAAGESCEIRMSFDPTATGPRSATMTIESNVPDHAIALTGAGLQTALSVAPDTLAFGSRDVADGPTAAQTSTVTNTGTEPVALSGLTLSGTDTPFERLTGDAGDCTTTTTLAATETCAVRVRFDPASAGAASATLTIASADVDHAIALTGSGTVTEPPAPVAPPPPPPAAPLDSGTPPPPPAAAAPLPGPVLPWTLERRGSPRVTATKAGLRVSTGYVASCPAGGPDCTGRLTLKLLRRSVATGELVPVFLAGKVAHVTIPAGGQRRVSFRLNAAGASELRALGSSRVRLRGSVRTGTSAPVVRSVSLRISAPR